MNAFDTNFETQQPFGQMLFWQVPAFRAWMTINRTLLRRASEVGSEWSSFLVSRLHEDMLLQQQLAACRSPADVQKTMAEFTERAVAQYGREIGRLGEVASRLSAELADAMKGEPDRNR